MVDDNEKTDGELTAIADSIHSLGNLLAFGGTSSPYGAVEVLVAEMKASSERVANALMYVLVSLDGIARAIADRNGKEDE